MNEHLKFSYGHIVAFLALIMLSYFTFVGVTYMTDGDFAIASVAMVTIDVVLFAVFIGSQMLKATARKFAKRILVERVLVFSSPIIFLICMLPFYHFGTVQTRDNEIVGNFTNAITASKQMFSDYDSYSKERLDNYEHMLERVINNQSIRPAEFVSCGFTKGSEQIQKRNMVEALQLQLISENYDSLKTEALKWIETSSVGASTWNVFLLGNTKEIKKAIHEWNRQLVEFSNHKMKNEDFKGYNKIKNFGEMTMSLDAVDKGLDTLTDKFTKTSFPPIIFILFSIILYFALLFPYFLQRRHTKNCFSLLGTKMPWGQESKNQPSQLPSEGKVDIPIDINEDDFRTSRPASTSTPQPKDDDDYEIFTM